MAFGTLSLVYMHMTAFTGWTTMTRKTLEVFALILLLLPPLHSSAGEKTYACAGASDGISVDEVWNKVAAHSCLKCHKAGGDAEDSKFVLRDPKRAKGSAKNEAIEHNLSTLMQIARLKEGSESRMLLKAVGKLKHGGEKVLKPDSADFRVLEAFVRGANEPTAKKKIVGAGTPSPPSNQPFFDGVRMLDDRSVLRRVTLSLAGRLPADAELAALEKSGSKALPGLIDAILKEDAFYDRLREAFNDIFLTIGLEDNAETVLAYDHFSKTRGWTEKHDLSSIADEKARQKARYKLADEYRKAIHGEPMKLIEHIVREERPFTEIVTADYIMITPYTARGYGIYDELKEKFKNPDDPFEYIPVKLKALAGREKSLDQESATGFYPHAGLLSTFQYLRKYPTTETNRNRLRARMYYQQFLGVDVLELAPRVTDAAAIQAKYEIPTMQAAECVVCHKTVDPVAGCFQDYWKFEGVYGKRKGGWFKDMFGAGFEGENLPENERWRALQWLGERTAKDARFASAMVEHVYYILTGRKVLQPPKDLDDPLFNAKRRAFQEQRNQIETIAARFAQTNFNLKNVFKDWIQSDFYRVDGFGTIAGSPERKAELSDTGVVRMLAPEQVERKVAAVFGAPWGKLKDEQFAMLYGGIDSKEVTERATDPSGAMGAIQRILSNDIACKQTMLDFSRKPADRRLFPNIEPDVLPGSSPEADEKIRRTIIHLHERILGRFDAIDSPEVERTYNLFAEIVDDAVTKNKRGNDENWFCRQNLAQPVSDPKYTVRGWRAVVTYLLRRQEFLYE